MISNAELCYVRPDSGDDSRDLVAQHSRYWNNVVSREQQVGVTKTGCLHIDQNFAANWRRDIDVFKFESASERVNNKCFHTAAYDDLPGPVSANVTLAITLSFVGLMISLSSRPCDYTNTPSM